MRRLTDQIAHATYVGASVLLVVVFWVMVIGLIVAAIFGIVQLVGWREYD